MKKLKINLSTIDDVKTFVELVNKADFDSDLATGKYVVDAKSIMGIFSLDLGKPLDLTIHSDDCSDFIEDIEKFIVK